MQITVFLWINKILQGHSTKILSVTFTEKTIFAANFLNEEEFAGHYYRVWTLPSLRGCIEN